MLVALGAAALLACRFAPAPLWENDLSRLTPVPPALLARDRALVDFVKRVTAICRGKAYFTNTMTLGQFILMDFMRRKTRRVS